MAESCPGTTYAKLAWLQAWHVRDETYSTALADLVNAQFRHPFAGHWGDGTTSSSDGQRTFPWLRGEPSEQASYIVDARARKRAFPILLRAGQCTVGCLVV